MPQIHYLKTLENIYPESLDGFFVGWPKKPTLQKHLELLKNSDHFVIALNEEKMVVGFITAITDGVLSAYIPFLEVLPEYQGQGIGAELTKLMLTELKDLYMIDLVCDPKLQPFYEKFGMKKATSMIIRNFEQQAGK